MTDMSSRIYTALFPTLGTNVWIPMPELEQKLGVRERGLQTEGDKPGPLLTATMEIYRTYGVALITRNGKGGGVRLTNSAELVRGVRDRLKNQVWHTNQWVREWTKMLNELGPGQSELPV